MNKTEALLDEWISANNVLKIAIEKHIRSKLILINTSNGHYKSDYIRWFTCPNCNSDEVQQDSNYCSECGCKIEWFDD